MTEKLLTVREVSRILNVHINTIRRWSDSGLLRCYRLGSRKDRRFSLKDLTEFLNKDKKETN